MGVGGGRRRRRSPRGAWHPRCASSPSRSTPWLARGALPRLLPSPLGAALAEKLLRVSPAAAAAEPRAAASVALALTALARGRAGGVGVRGAGAGVGARGGAACSAGRATASAWTVCPHVHWPRCSRRSPRRASRTPGLQTLLLRAAQERAARRALTVGAGGEPRRWRRRRRRALHAAGAIARARGSAASRYAAARDWARRCARTRRRRRRRRCARLAAAGAKAKVASRSASFRQQRARGRRLPARAPQAAVFGRGSGGRGLFAVARAAGGATPTAGAPRSLRRRAGCDRTGSPADGRAARGALSPPPPPPTSPYCCPYPCPYCTLTPSLAAGHLCHGLRLRRRPPPPRAPGARAPTAWRVPRASSRTSRASRERSLRAPSRRATSRPSSRPTTCAGLRAEGLFEVMSAAWALRWGEPFESEADMVEFLTTLTPDSSPGPELSLFQQEKRAGQLRQ